MVPAIGVLAVAVDPETSGGSAALVLESGWEGIWAHAPSRTAAASDRVVLVCLEERATFEERDIFMVLAHPPKERVEV